MATTIGVCNNNGCLDQAKGGSPKMFQCRMMRNSEGRRATPDASEITVEDEQCGFEMIQMSRIYSYLTFDSPCVRSLMCNKHDKTLAVFGFSTDVMLILLNRA